MGREEELALLHRRWEQVKDREGQVVLLSGEPGIGKSRLVRELRDRVEQDGAIRIEFRCSPYHQNSALYPVIEHLQRLLQWQKDDTPQIRTVKLQATLARYRFPQADTPALFAALLSLPHPADAPPLNLSPQRQKQKTEEALIAWLVEEAEQAPVYCAWEDLHWADPSTLELLGMLIDQTPTTRLFVLLTSRPEFTPPWGQHGHFSQLTLSRLGRRQVPQMIEQATGGKTLPTEVVQQIVAKTDGVPLFVEELTKMVVESGLLTETNGHYELSGPLPPLAIPSTLQDSLMARLDRLATTKEIAQVGATLGREFSYDLLQRGLACGREHAPAGTESVGRRRTAVSTGDAAAEHLSLQACLDSGHGVSIAAQEHAASNSISRLRRYWKSAFLKRKRRNLSYSPITTPRQGSSRRPFPTGSRRGREPFNGRPTQKRSVISLTALSCSRPCRTLPNAPSRNSSCRSPGPAWMATKGYAAPEVELAYTRARELCQQTGRDSSALPGAVGAGGVL